MVPRPHHRNLLLKNAAHATLVRFSTGLRVNCLEEAFVIRMLIALVVVGLGMVLVLQQTKRLPVDTQTGPAETTLRTPVQEAEQVKAILETQQDALQRRADRFRD